jgi:ADP-ribose pyrophosphatase
MKTPDHTDTPVPRVDSRTLLHHGRKFDVDLLKVSTNGQAHEVVGIRHPGAVVIVPVLDSPEGRQIVMVRNFRPVLGSSGKTIWELPAGTREPDEPVEVGAHRELAEETGYRADHLTALGRFYTTPGMTDEVMWAFAAFGLTHTGQRLEADEWMSVEHVPVGRALAMIDSGDLADAKSMLALLTAARRGLL